MPYKDYISQTAQKYGIDANLALRVAQAESSFNPNAKSSAGAIGLFQLMPGTAKGLGVDPYNWQQNVDGGLRYLSQQYKTFGSWDKALAAYNAGPGNVQKYGGIPPFKETQNYVNKILGGYTPPSNTSNKGVNNVSNPAPVLDPRIYGNSGQGTYQQMQSDVEQYTSNPQYLSDAIKRANEVIATRQKEGLDVSAQQLYLNKLLNTNIPNVQNVSEFNYTNPMLAGLQNSARQYSDAYMQNQQSQLGMMRDKQINEIAKAYEDAVAEGKISIREAEDAFNKIKQEINQQAYLDSQRTSLYAQQQGIQNSQQMLGLQAADDSRKNTLTTTAMTEKDKRISDIKDRINAISKQKSLDIANINANYDYGMLGAQGQADMMYADRMFGLQQGDYEANRNFNFDKLKMEIQQNYDLDKMTTAHGLDMEKLAAQFDHDMSMENLRFGHESSLIGQRSAAAMAQSKQEMLMAVQLEERKYQTALQREAAKYQKGTPEYMVSQSQLQAQFRDNVSNIIASSYAEALGTSLFSNESRVEKPKDPTRNWGALGRVVTGYNKKLGAWEAQQEEDKRMEAILRGLGLENLGF